MRAAYWSGYKGRNPKVPKELEGWTYWWEHADTRQQAEAVATRYKKAGFSMVRIKLEPRDIFGIRLFEVSGYAPPGYSGRNPTLAIPIKSKKLPVSLIKYPGYRIRIGRKLPETTLTREFFPRP